LAAARGVMRFDSNSSDLSRKDASPDLGSAAVAITNKSLAVLHFKMRTLIQKAKHFQMFVDQPGRHDKDGLVSDCSMSTWGDIRTCLKEPGDNDGEWTSMYLASQIFRYVVTQDEEVRAQAWKHFEAMELLNLVTVIPGYPARTFKQRSDFPSDIPWYPSPVYPTLQYEGDTSSDEICGHEFVYPLVHDNHILTHDWYLIGENHNHTQWGIWNPIQINNDSYYQEDRCINSLEILAFLLQTYGYSGDERFLDGANLLIESYQYNVNFINQKMIAVCDSSFDDDEMSYLLYFNLVHAFHTIASSTRLSAIQKTRVQSLIDDL
jgi:hypothetical protein